MAARKTVMSGTRPTGRLHLGNLWGALKKWTAIQDDYDCYFAVVDWHMLTTSYDRTEELQSNIREMVLDWLAAGLDPAKCTFFKQSLVPEHAELYLLLSMVTPLSWLENNPTWKEQLQELSKTKLSKALECQPAEASPEVQAVEADESLRTHGFLGYPVLQAADILLYDADLVPVGQDQLPHLELSREIARRFNCLYGQVLREPKAMPTEVPKLPGTDGRKMSKSYGNTLNIFETAADLKSKVMSMYTDPTRARANDPGHPEPCPENPPGCVVFALHKLYSAHWESRGTECRAGQIGCVACKKDLLKSLEGSFSTFREARARFDAATVDQVLEEGSAKARVVAQRTLERVRKAMRLR